MRYIVNEQCVGCGLCARLCPDVFTIGKDGFAHAVSGDVPKKALEAADGAYDDCPAEAIHPEYEKMK